MKKSLVLLLMAVVFSGVIGCRGAGNPEAEKAAVAAAEEWLALIDSQSYGESWEAAATLFRDAVPKDQWVSVMKSGQAPLGKALSRAVASKRYLTAVPNAPAGQYVVIEFNTDFENKKAAVETVTPMLDKDGTWRVSGYYIR